MVYVFWDPYRHLKNKHYVKKKRLEHMNFRHQLSGLMTQLEYVTFIPRNI